MLGHPCRCATLLTRSTRQHRPSTCPLSHQRHRHVDALGGYSVLGPWASWSCARWFMLSLLRWVPLGPWSGSLFTTAGWAHRAAVCEYVTAYTFLCAPCLRCYRLSLDLFFARVGRGHGALWRVVARVPVGPGAVRQRHWAMGSGLRASSVVSSRLAGAETEPAARRRDRPAVPARPTPSRHARRGAGRARRAAHKAARFQSEAAAANAKPKGNAIPLEHDLGLARFPPPPSYTVQARSRHARGTALQRTHGRTARTIWAMMQTDSHKSVHRAALRRARVTCASSWPRSTRSLPAVDQAIVESRP